MSQGKDTQHVMAVFKVICETSYGESVYLLGNTGELHSWDLGNPIRLHSSHYTAADPVWETEELRLPANTGMEYKFFKKSKNGNIRWEWPPDRNNRQICFDSGKQIEVLQTYGISHKEIIIKGNVKSLEETKGEGVFLPASQNVQTILTLDKSLLRRRRKGESHNNHNRRHSHLRILYHAVHNQQDPGKVLLRRVASNLCHSRREYCTLRCSTWPSRSSRR